MDKTRRDNLRSIIGKARREVEESLRRQLVGYGLFTDAPALAKEHLSLRAEQEAQYQRVLDAVGRESRAPAARRLPSAMEAGTGAWLKRCRAAPTSPNRGTGRPPRVRYTKHLAGPYAPREWSTAPPHRSAYGAVAAR